MVHRVRHARVTLTAASGFRPTPLSSTPSQSPFEMDSWPLQLFGLPVRIPRGLELQLNDNEDLEAGTNRV